MQSVHALELASAAPFSGTDAIAILAFMIDLAVGPLSLVVLAVAAIARSGWRRWIAAVAAVNLALALLLLATEDDGLGPFVALVWLQAAIAIAVLTAGARDGWRRVLFG